LFPGKGFLEIENVRTAVVLREVKYDNLLPLADP